MTKTILFTLVLLCAVIQGVQADEQIIAIIENENDFNKLIDNAHCKLKNDIQLTAEVIVGNGKNWTLDLNGHTLDRGLTAAAD